MIVKEPCSSFVNLYTNNDRVSIIYTPYHINIIKIPYNKLSSSI